MRPLAIVKSLMIPRAIPQKNDRFDKSDVVHLFVSDSISIRLADWVKRMWDHLLYEESEWIAVPQIFLFKPVLVKLLKRVLDSKNTR